MTACAEDTYNSYLSKALSSNEIISVGVIFNCKLSGEVSLSLKCHYNYYYEFLTPSSIQNIVIIIVKDELVCFHKIYNKTGK